MRVTVNICRALTKSQPLYEQFANYPTYVIGEMGSSVFILQGKKGEWGSLAPGYTSANADWGLGIGPSICYCSSLGENPVQ